MATINMTPGQKITLNVLGLVAPNPGRLVGAPTWASSDPTKIALRPARDGITCEALSLGPTGTSTITVSAIGATPLNATVDLTVAAVPLATSVVIGASGAPGLYP